MKKNLIKKEFQKGLSIIVGKDNGNEIITDGVVIYDSYSLSVNQPQLLDSKINYENTTDIYICGHGKDNCIDGRSMKDIAEKLVESGYSGGQIIHIMSCHSKSINEEKGMEELFKEELEKLLKLQIIVVSQTLNTSLLVEKDTNSAIFYDIKLGVLFGMLQPQFLLRHKLYKLSLDKHNYSSTLNEYFNRSKIIKGYNYSIAEREGYSIIGLYKRFIAAFIGELLALLIMPLGESRLDLGLIGIGTFVSIFLITETMNLKSKASRNITWRINLVSIVLLIFNILNYVIQVIRTRSNNADAMTCVILILFILIVITIYGGFEIVSRCNYYKSGNIHE